jgi:N-acetylmuramoyl-L-alanine amidase
MPAGATIKTICLDAGHGGKDPGNMEGTTKEKNLTLLLSREVETLLEKAGYKVVTTRSRDEFIDRDQRPIVANRRKADLFISLHFNSAPATSASGIEVFCLTPAGAPSSHGSPEGYNGNQLPGNKNDEQNVLLAHCVQKATVKQTKTIDRGIVRARYDVLRTTAMPAILVEGGFMTNPAEGRRIREADYRRSLAEGIVDGIKAYARLVERPN